MGLHPDGDQWRDGFDGHGLRRQPETGTGTSLDRVERKVNKETG